VSFPMVSSLTWPIPTFTFKYLSGANFMSELHAPSPYCRWVVTQRGSVMQSVGAARFSGAGIQQFETPNVTRLFPPTCQ